MSSIEYINSVVLTASAASVEFTSIPQQYNDLLLNIYTATNTSDNDVIMLNFNADTGSNYSYTRLFGNGSSVSSDRTSNQTYIDSAFMSATNPDLCTINIMSYSNSNMFKTLLIEYGTPNSSNSNTNRRIVMSEVGLWRSNNSINRITLDFNTLGVSFVAGSTFTLWGVR